MKTIIFLFVGLVFIQGVFAEKYKDSFVEAAYSGNVMLVKTHINDLKGKGKEKHNEALRAAVSAAEVPTEAVKQSPSSSKLSKISAKLKGSTTEVVKLLLAAGADPNDQSFGRPTIFSTAPNSEVKALLEAAGGKFSIADQLALIVKNHTNETSPEDFQNILTQAKPGEIKLGNGMHIPTLIFESYNLKREGELIPYMQNQTPLVNMYVALAISKKASDLFVVYSAANDSEFGRKEKTEPLVGRFLENQRWDLLEILVDHDAEIPAPVDSQLAAKWFEYRSNLILSLIEKTDKMINPQNFNRMNQFFDSVKIQKFNEFSKRLPPISPEKLEGFFAEANLQDAEKFKFVEGMNLKVATDMTAKYIAKLDKQMTEQEFKRLERLTERGKKVDSELLKSTYESGNIKIAQYLLRLGASPDETFDGDSGLCIAIKKNNFQLAQLLVTYKASKTGTCRVGQPPAKEAKTVPYEQMPMTPIMSRLLGFQPQAQQQPVQQPPEKQSLPVPELPPAPPVPEPAPPQN